ncbi:class II aldolase/adducin family protein [Streptomyces sp. NPDC002795]|uniref:class II aldolase/adducin family protein n=1 Tax=Streptomyces sp. NPDC002795 TaxID=3364665 RepID=UPI003675A8ED
MFAALLRNHGLLTVGDTPGRAFLRMYYLDKACDIQLAAQAGGSLTIPPREVCEYTARQLNDGDARTDLSNEGEFEPAWAALLRLVERIAPDYVD